MFDLQAKKQHLIDLSLSFLLEAGVCISCAKEKCTTTFHVECARRAKFYLETKG